MACRQQLWLDKQVMTAAAAQSGQVCSKGRGIRHARTPGMKALMLSLQAALLGLEGGWLLGDADPLSAGLSWAH